MAKESKYSLTPQKQAAIDKVVRECAGKAAVENLIKSSLNPKYAVYQFFGLSDGNVCMVSIGEEIKAHLLPASSATVKNWKRQRVAGIKRDEARAAAKLASLERKVTRRDAAAAVKAAKAAKKVAQ